MDLRAFPVPQLTRYTQVAINLCTQFSSDCQISQCVQNQKVGIERSFQRILVILVGEIWSINGLAQFGPLIIVPVRTK